MLISKEELRMKILELFEYRALPEIIDMVEKDVQKKNQLLNHLISIQESIYHLDHVLESEWDIIHSTLDYKWKDIFQSMKDAGVDGSKLHQYCSHIFKYQKHELEQRQGKSLLRLSLEYFYYYKSCDVKLLRRLIYDNYRSLRSLMALSDWRWFDLVTEVNDDIDDVYEDLNTNNGNRFLLSIREYGIDKAYDIYLDFLKNIVITFRKKQAEKSIHPLITELTLNELKKTVDLLNRRRIEIHQRPLLRSVPEAL